MWKWLVAFATHHQKKRGLIYIKKKRKKRKKDHMSPKEKYIYIETPLLKSSGVAR